MAQISIVNKSELEGALRLDAEYYQSAYIHTIEAVQCCSSSRKIEEIAKVLRGRNPRKYTESGIPVIRAIDLRDITNWENVLCANPEENLFYLKHGDILISSIGAGSIGKIQLFLETDKKVATVSEVSVIRTKNYSPFTLAAFLMSKYGYLQLERRITGSTGQLHLYPKDIGTVLTPILDQRVQNQLEDMISTSHKYLMQSKSLYLQAEQRLLDELGLDNFDFSQPNYYSVPLSQAQEVNRVDAEHFQPKYDKLIQHLIKTGRAKPLEKIAPYIKRGLQPIYIGGGEVLVFTEKHLTRSLLNIESAETTDIAFWKKNRQARIEKNDILLYSIGAYIGRANCYLEDRKAVTSSNVTIIKVDKSEANPVYVSVFLNSIAGRMQAEKWTASVGQMALYAGDVPKFIIYLPSEKFQAEIADLVIQSHKTRKKAKALLGEAKKIVEEMIGRNKKRG